MTNSAAIGYMILAMMTLGYDVEAIKEMEDMMTYHIDMKTEVQAVNIYNCF